MSYLSVRTGPMYSGKTSWLIQVMNKHCFSKKRVLKINSCKDTRKSIENGITSTHNPSITKVHEDMVCVKTDLLQNVNVEEFDVIGIDECQWYDDLSETIQGWLSKSKKIYCVGLDSNFHGKKYGTISELLPFADEFKKKSSDCVICHQRAIFSKILTENHSGNSYVVDNGENYAPVCREHFLG